MYYSGQGETLKKFNTRDEKGLELIRSHVIDVPIVTSENSDIVTSRAQKLGISHCYIGITDKEAHLKKLFKELTIMLTQVGYVGDNINDAESMKLAGFAACPSDAADEIRSIVAYESPYAGGHGAVRDVCEFIIHSITNTSSR